jgi:hypothetical protein
MEPAQFTPSGEHSLVPQGVVVPSLRHLVRLASLALVALLPSLAAAQQFSKEQIDQLTAQIALYPDALLSQVLMASTYPADVEAAAKWSREHPDAKGDEAVQQVQDRDWDPSVASLVAVPQVVITMGEKPDWVRDLGDAFLAQPEDVMDSVQRLRAQAQQAGNLTSNEQVNVRVESAPPAEPEVTVVQQAAPRQVIVIEQTRPETIFVPAYNPSVVYGAWPYPAFPPVYIPPPPGYWWSAAIGGAVATGIAWGVGYGVSNAIWGGCNWWHRDIDININRYNNINVNRRLDINTDRARWAHDTRHRRAVPYRGGDGTKQQLARKYDASKRDAYRGRAESAMRDKGIQVDRAAVRDRAQNIDRDKARNAMQNVDRDKARNTMQNVDRDKARNAMQKVDRDRASAQLKNMNRDSALRDANKRQARTQIDRGNASRQSMQRQRPRAERPQPQRPQVQHAERQRPQVNRGGGGNRPQVQRGGGRARAERKR